MSDLLDSEGRKRLDGENRELQDRLRTQHAEKERKPLLPFADARANPQRPDFTDLPVPSFTGRRVVEPDLETILRYIDWQFFFHAWELKGKFPALLEQPAARELYDDALAVLDQIVSTRALPAAGRVRLLACAAPTATTSCSRTGVGSTSCASRARTGTRARTSRSPTSSRRAATTSGRSRSRSTAPTSSPLATRPSTTTTTRSSSRPWLIASPRRSPSTCTRSRGASGTRPARSSRART